MTDIPESPGAAGPSQEYRAALDSGPGAIRRRKALDDLPFLVAYVDKSHCYLMVNRAYEEWFGVRRREVVGHHLRDVLGDEAYEAVLPRVERALSGEAVRFEARLPYRNGPERSVVASYVPDFDEQGEVRGYLGIIDDVTAEREAIEQLERSEVRYRSLVQATPGMVWSSRAAGGRGDPGDMLAFTGLSAEQFQRGGWLEAVHPEDHDRVRTTWGNAAAERRTYETVYRLRRHDGVYRRVFIRAVPVFGADGALVEWIGTCTDIEDEERSKEQLIASEARAARLFESDVMGLVYADRHGRFYRANDCFLEMTGYSREEIEGGAVLWNAITPPEFGHLDARAIEEVDARGSCTPYEKEYWRKDGTRVPILVGIALIESVGGAEYSCFVLDLSRQKQAEAAREQALSREKRHSEHLRRLAQVGVELASANTLNASLDVITQAAAEIGDAHLAVTSLSRDGHWRQGITSVVLSERYAQYRGYDVPPDGSGIYALVCEQNRPMRLTQAELVSHPAWRGFGEHAAAHPPLNGWLAVPLIARDGRNLGVIQLSDKRQGEFDEADEALLTQLAQLAASAIEQAELIGELRRANVRSELLSNMAAAMVGSTSEEEVDVREVATLAVPAFADLCIVDRIAGDHITRIIVARDGLGVQDLEARFLEQTPVLANAGDRVASGIRNGVSAFVDQVPPERLADFARDECHLKLLQELQPVSFMSAPLVAAGRTFGAVSFALAQTTNRFAAADFEVAQEFGRRIGAWLERARLLDDLQKANAVKDEVLGMVSHELRTPLTTLKGNANVLRRHGDKIPAASRDLALADIERDSERLQRIVENMLILARVEGAASPDLEPLLLRRVIEATITEHRGQHPEQKVTLDLPDEIFPILGHETYLRQVLLNLLSNAAKYADRGKPVDISLRRDGNFARVTVADRGVGIPAEAAERIFEPFFRSGRDSARAAGMGLGLTVCKRLVEAQGGSISARPREGGGTEFTFTVPLIQDALADI